MEKPSGNLAHIDLWARRIYAAVVCIFGVSLLIGGAILASEGGTPYYALAGVATTASGILAWRADRRSSWIYGAMLVATVAWSVWEIGFDFWGLLPRLAAPFFIGLGFFLPSVRGAGEPFRLARVGGIPMFAAALVGAVAIGWTLTAIDREIPLDPIWQTGKTSVPPGRLPQPLAEVSGGEWLNWGNDQGGTRFSPLAEINVSNVGRLQVAWEADFGPAKPELTGAMEATPLMVGNSLYLCNMANEVIAYDAETGHEKWRHDMTAKLRPASKPCRGVAYYRVPNADGPCARRIIAPTQTAELVALDATTGAACPDFGRDGRISLREGLRNAPIEHYYISSAPEIVRGKIVVGGPVLDGQFWNGPSGVIRAYDAVTGRLAWAFDVGHPEWHGAPPPGDAYTPSTPNSWAPISADEKLGLVYLPTGNTSGSDYYGAMRRPFDDAISSSVIALDVDTGQLRWRFQTTHHDLWDYDVPSQPTLVDLPMPQGGSRRALIQPTKRGEIFVLDRVTGQPIKPVAELPAPQGNVAPGEPLSPTQPFSVGMPSFRGPELREADMWGITPIDQLICRIQFVRSRYEGTLTPLTPGKPTIVAPGYGGGSNWGSISVDIDRGILIANTNRMPNRMTLISRADAEREGVHIYTGEGPPPAARPQLNTPYAITGGPFLSFTGAPCVRPPYGNLTAVDLISGRVIWTKPLGTARDSGPFGLASHLPITMGVPMVGGSLVTRGGLTFVAATQERIFRAFETATGKLLWQARLPGGGNVVPMTYRAPISGRQMVVIAAPGNSGLKSQKSTKLLAYALSK